MALVLSSNAVAALESNVTPLKAALITPFVAVRTLVVLL
jgi:hypothetical protein